MRIINPKSENQKFYKNSLIKSHCVIWEELGDR